MTTRVERPGAEQWVPERLTLPSLRGAVQQCHGCELYLDATQGVMGEGEVPAPLMLVGEQPGDREDQVGEPFVGPAGRMLDRALAEADIDPATIFKTNVVKHFRFAGTRGKQRIHKSPSRVHVAACEPWLLAELDLVRPQGVVLLGGTAGQALYGSSFRVGASRGRLRGWPAGSRLVRHRPEWVLATTHPSAVLRSRNREDDFEAFVGDLKVAAAALGMSAS
jgi:uracil-DNA glycosylase